MPMRRIKPVQNMEKKINLTLIASHGAVVRQKSSLVARMLLVRYGECCVIYRSRIVSLAEFDDIPHKANGRNVKISMVRA